MKTVLVTGGAGFIGGTLVRQLVAETDWNVVNLDALTYASDIESLGDAMQSSRHAFVQGDIQDEPLVNQVFGEHSPDAVIHLAAETHVDRSIDEPAAFIKTNVLGTFTLLHAALTHWKLLPERRRRSFRFLHVSTDEVFGSLGSTGLFLETTPYSPNSPYSASKASADHLVRAYHHTYGLPAIITNCSNNYGPFQFPEKLIPLMTLNALEGHPLPVYGDGRQVRDWLYVEDHCHALRCVLERGAVGESYNVGGNSERTNLEIVERICEYVDAARSSKAGSCRRLIQFVTDRPGHDRRYAIDASRIRDEIGWIPQASFESGLRRTVEWYVSHPEWAARVAQKGYRRERLGLKSAPRPISVEKRASAA